MQPSRLSPGLREAIAGARAVAASHGQPWVAPEHLLLAAIDGGGGGLDALWRARSASPAPLRAQLEALVDVLPRGAGESALSDESRALLAAADREAGGAPIGMVHVLAALALLPRSPAAGWLRKSGFTRGRILVALGGQEARTPILDRYGRDLTALAADGRLDPLAGRARELKRLMQVLGRRTKSNPVLVGPPGVGKTALVEGLAQRIAAGEVPGALCGARLVELDLGALLAGARLRGELEERLQAILRELAAAREVVLFLDEIHRLVGAGAGEGAIDAASMLKPALTRGELRCVGTTTDEEYLRLIERDRALERRLQPIRVAEPSVEEAGAMLRALAPGLEAHHGVELTDGALAAAARLAHRYVAGRALPDKAIDALDEAASLARLDRDTGPYRLDHPPRVDEGEVARVIGDWTGIPIPRLVEEERQKLERFEERLRARVVGQERAVARVAAAIRRARAGLADGRRPIGSFLFLGPTGVGKTELARALADLLFDDPGALVRIDGSEHLERHTAARLIGAPPGYLGYEQGGQLTEAVRRRPYAVVLFDEIEKAHPDVWDLLLQILDDGRLTDGHGRTITFRDALVVLTSNLRDPEAARARFRPELWNRLDEVVAFDPLGPGALRAVAAIALERVRRRAADLGVLLTFDDRAVAHLAAVGSDPLYGARPLERAVRRLVEEPLADRVLAGAIGAGDRVRVTVAGSAIAWIPEPGARRAG